MLKGMSRYLLTADVDDHKTLQLRADGGFGAQSRQQTPTVFRNSTEAQKNRSERINTDARFEKNIMDDFIAYQSNDVMRAIARDMLFHDPISGTAVKLLSDLPFSDFEVAAVPDREKEKHVASLNAMHMRDMLPAIALEKYTEGKHLSMMNYNEDQGAFTGIIPFDPAACDLTYLPVYGRDPIVDVRVSDHLRALVSNPDARVQKELDHYADDVKDMIRASGRFPVPQEYLLYVANQAFSYMPQGVSAFRRIAAVWLYEKNLARGTMDMSSRRQKALLHAVLGDDEFIPTNQQLAEVGDMIANAERNPVGAMIVTRPGLDINEVGDNGSGIWRWDETYDFFTTTKLRGLGLSDSIFGDFSVQEAENTLSSVIEMLSETRASITERVLVQRVGLTVAVKNDFRKVKQPITGADDYDPRYIVSRRSNYLLTGDAGDADAYVNPDDYSLPQYRYNKVLRLVSNSQLFENLNTLDPKMPIPLRILASALGQSVDEIISSYDEDIKIREKIVAYQSKLPKPPPGAAAGGDDGNDDSSQGGIFDASDKPNRNFDHIEMRDPQTRRLLTAKGARAWNEKKIKLILEAGERVRENERRKAQEKSRARERTTSTHYSR